MSHTYVLPDGASWDDAPYLGSWKGRDVLQDAMPLLLKTSLESGKAAELVMGNYYKGNDSGKTPIEFANGVSPRVEATVARSGIISQFELWKEFASLVGFPISRKQAKRFTFNSELERETLFELVDLRNELTHEVTIDNDPTMKRFVEFSYSCRWLATQAAAYD